MASEDRRLHPLSWLFAAAQSAKGFIVPLLVVLFASGGDSYELWAALFVIPVTVGAVVQYVVFRYRLGPEELVVRDGILTRTERHIPYDRIQNIDLVQNPFHRLMNVALVRVETASGAKPEAIIRVLSLDAVNEMRRRVFAGRPGWDGEHNASTRQPDALFTLPTGEIVRLGIVSNKGLVVVGAVAGLVFGRGQFWGQDPETQAAFVEEFVGTTPDWLGGTAATTTVGVAALALIGLVLAIALLRLLSIGWFFVQLYGFRLTKSDDELRANYGLFTRITRTIPTPRIQTLTTTETPVHRWFNRQTIELRTVGGGGGGEDLGLESGSPKARNQWLAPMIETVRVSALVNQILPEVSLQSLEWKPLGAGAQRRILRRFLAGVAAVTLVAVFTAEPFIVLLAFTLPGAVAAYIHARLYVEHAGYAIAPWGIAFKSGWLNRTLKLVHYDKIQTVEQGETPVDRRHGMASVKIDTAGAASMRHTIEIPYLDLPIATAMTQHLYRESSQQAFRW